MADEMRSSWSARRDSEVELLVAELRGVLADRVSTSMALREQHSKEEGLPDAALPDIVVSPHSNEEVLRSRQCVRAGVSMLLSCILYLLTENQPLYLVAQQFFNGMDIFTIMAIFHKDALAFLATLA